MVDAMKVKRSIYFATLQGYVIFETELYTKSCQFHEAHADFMLVLFFGTQERNIDFGG